jgi:hypothetical protein
MTTPIDTLLTELGQRPTDRSLGALSADVWRRIDAHADPAGAAPWGWRAAVVALVMTGGVIASGAAAARPNEVHSPFAINADFAPLTLLEGDR